jgi:hypothetical protein
LRDVAAELARLRYLNVNGKPFAAMSVKSILGEGTYVKRLTLNAARQP